MSELYIGVMSGTSLDAIDIVLCKIDDSTCKLLYSNEYPFEDKLKQKILNIISNPTTLKEIGTLDNELGNLFADAINKFIKQNSIERKDIRAIGLHGQTLWHEPDSKHPFSMQLGSPSVVSTKTEIQVSADFRSMDIANGGQGAPFAPAFHKEIFGSLGKNIAVLNIGGMANITILQEDLKGWDCGCGNVLMDGWISTCRELSYDKDGMFARSGEVDTVLLNMMLKDNYFQKSSPKSTGREYFNKKWLQNYLSSHKKIKDEDIQRTLLELTAQTIIKDVSMFKIKLLLVCGGGVHNIYLMQRLRELSGIELSSTDYYGVSSDFIEAMTFAWLGYKRVHRQEVDLKLVTGASKNSILGGIYG